jgi:hypothetical protein
VIESKCRSGVSIAVAKQGAAEAMRILVDQQRIVIPIAGVFRIYGLSTKVHGFSPHPSQTAQTWSTVWLSK